VSSTDENVNDGVVGGHPHTSQPQLGQDEQQPAVGLHSIILGYVSQGGVDVGVGVGVGVGTLISEQS
jgi:hypothetical protein